MTIFLHLVISFLLLFPVFPFSSDLTKIFHNIEEINSKGPYIGLITVYHPEEDAFFATDAFELDSKYPYLDLSGREFLVGTIHGKKVIYVRCGVGMDNATAATKQMLKFFNIEGIIHFGISGNTDSYLNIGDVTIRSQFVNTGSWNWLKPNATIPPSDFAALEIRDYNVPKEGSNSLRRIGDTPEEFYYAGGQPNNAQQVIWFNVIKNWLQLASKLEGLKLKKCVKFMRCLKNGCLNNRCLHNKPKVVIGVKASTSNAFVDNAAYRDFLFQTFGVSSADMESTAVIMTSLSKGYPIIVIRGLSNLAGAEDKQSSIDLHGTLAADNVAKVVIKFLKLLPKKY